MLCVKNHRDCQKHQHTNQPCSVFFCLLSVSIILVMASPILVKTTLTWFHSRFRCESNKTKHEKKINENKHWNYYKINVFPFRRLYIAYITLSREPLFYFRFTFFYTFLLFSIESNETKKKREEKGDKRIIHVTLGNAQSQTQT